MESKVILGSWPIRAIIQPTRYLLEYLEIPYEERVYTPSEWIIEKPKLDFDFPNIPYLIDGDLKLTEAKAIGFYLIMKSGRKGMAGKNLDDKVLIETFHTVTVELGSYLYILTHTTKDQLQAKKEEIYPKFIKRLVEISKRLGQRDWLLGYLSFADFLLTHTIEWICAFEPKILHTNQFQNLKNWIHRFYRLEPIKNYRKNKVQYKTFVLNKSFPSMT